MDQTAMQQMNALRQALLTGAATPGIIQLRNGKVLEYAPTHNYVAACAIGMIAIGQCGSPEQAEIRGRSGYHTLFGMDRIAVRARPAGCDCTWEKNRLQSQWGYALGRVIVHLNDIHGQTIDQITAYLVEAAPTARFDGIAPF